MCVKILFFTLVTSLSEANISLCMQTITFMKDYLYDYWQDIAFWIDDLITLIGTCKLQIEII